MRVALRLHFDGNTFLAQSFHQCDQVFHAVVHDGVRIGFTEQTAVRFQYCPGRGAGRPGARFLPREHGDSAVRFQVKTKMSLIPACQGLRSLRSEEYAPYSSDSAGHAPSFLK